VNPSTFPSTSRGNASAGGRTTLPGNSRRAGHFGARVVAAANVKARVQQVEDLAFHLREPRIWSFTADFFPLPFGPIFVGPGIAIVRPGVAIVQIDPAPQVPPERRSGGRKVADRGIASPEPARREPEKRAPRRTPARRFV